jgi:hypothetical protein
MARSFNGSSDAITISANLAAYNRLTIAFWLNWTTFANNDALGFEYSPNYNGNNGGILCDPNASSPNSGTFIFGVNLGGVTTGEFTRPSAGVWHQYVAILDGTQTGANQVSTVYVDGISQSLTHSLTSGTPNNFGNYSLYLMSRNASSLFGAGSMADFAIWGGAILSPVEAVGLAHGMRPWQIRPQALIHFYPFDNYGHPALDKGLIINTGTLTGTTFALGPPLISPVPILPGLPEADTVMQAMFMVPPPPFVLMPQILW